MYRNTIKQLNCNNGDSTERNSGTGAETRATARTRAGSSARDDAHRRAETDASVGARTNGARTNGARTNGARTDDARTDGATVHVAQPFPSAIREAPPEDA